MRLSPRAVDMVCGLHAEVATLYVNGKPVGQIVSKVSLTFHTSRPAEHSSQSPEVTGGYA